ncbi:hypothetical protein [Candidatus Bartonella washoeensis]|uniref:hypothetical protein n=1 Tax=Candidatus Bartonella washoeensis TaxID=186739 RepID=UPI0002DF6567|nr:hypothetical protein [Bartonella washoeensis]
MVVSVAAEGLVLLVGVVASRTAVVREILLCRGALAWGHCNIHFSFFAQGERGCFSYQCPFCCFVLLCASVRHIKCCMIVLLR